MTLTWATYRGPYIYDAAEDEWSSQWTKAFLVLRLKRIAPLYSFQRSRWDGLPSWRISVGPLCIEWGLDHGWDYIQCGEHTA